MEELPGVLWAYRTTPGRPTGNTPFALAYGMDAVIPTEIGLPTIRTDVAKQNDANTELGRNLDWTDEVRENAAIWMADYQQRASAHYNRKVKPRSFKNGTLVLRKVFENTAEIGVGKLQANWEGPYIVSKACENGAYHLQKLDVMMLFITIKYHFYFRFKAAIVINDGKDEEQLMLSLCK